MFGWLKGSGKTPAAQRQAITCAEIKISGAPQSTRLLDGMAIPRHRRDVVPVAASARNLNHWLISAQVPLCELLGLQARRTRIRGAAVYVDPELRAARSLF